MALRGRFIQMPAFVEMTLAIVFLFAPTPCPPTCAAPCSHLCSGGCFQGAAQTSSGPFPVGSPCRAPTCSRGHLGSLVRLGPGCACRSSAVNLSTPGKLSVQTSRGVVGARLGAVFLHSPCPYLGCCASQTKLHLHFSQAQETHAHCPGERAVASSIKHPTCCQILSSPESAHLPTPSSCPWQGCLEAGTGKGDAPKRGPLGAVWTVQGEGSSGLRWPVRCRTSVRVLLTGPHCLDSLVRGQREGVMWGKKRWREGRQRRRWDGGQQPGRDQATREMPGCSPCPGSLLGGVPLPLTQPLHFQAFGGAQAKQ